MHYNIISLLYIGQQEKIHLRSSKTTFYALISRNVKKFVHKITNFINRKNYLFLGCLKMEVRASNYSSMSTRGRGRQTDTVVEKERLGPGPGH